MPTAAVEDAVEHEVIGVLAVSRPQPDLVAQRVQHAAGLPLGVQRIQSEQMAAEVVQPLARVPLVDGPEVRGERQQQGIQRRWRCRATSRNGLVSCTATVRQTPAARRGAPALLRSMAASSRSSKPFSPSGQIAA
jgi:hypothetical protein